MTPRVDAASQVIDENTSGDDVKILEEDDATKKKKRTKEKVGFRDRKVSVNIKIFNHYH